MRWLCLDPGAKRTGVAISSPEETFAVPVTVLEHERGGPSAAQIEALLAEHDADGLLIGFPLSMNGSPSSQTTSALALAHRIAAQFNSTAVMPPGVDLPDSVCPVLEHDTHDSSRPTPLRIQLWDERLSSWDAQRAVNTGGKERRTRRGRKPALDAHAATVILQSYLSTRNRERGLQPDPGDDSEPGSDSRD